MKVFTRVSHFHLEFRRRRRKSAEPVGEKPPGQLAQEAAGEDAKCVSFIRKDVRNVK